MIDKSPEKDGNMNSNESFNENTGVVGLVQSSSPDLKDCSRGSLEQPPMKWHKEVLKSNIAKKLSTRR
jgi:hypothetical protein